MKIGDEFNMNMIGFPAKVSFIKMPVKRIREMILDSPEKVAARKLTEERNIKVFDEDDRIEIAYNLENGEREYGYWEFMFPSNPRYDLQAKIIRDLGLVPEQDKVVDLIAERNTGVVQLESVIGHADTAKIVSSMLGIELPANRRNVKLTRGEKMIVAQYSGPRLPEGATTLPEGAKIEFILVEVGK